MRLTLQIFGEGTWQDAAQLTLNRETRQVSIVYLQTYALEHLFANQSAALSVNLPVELFLTYSTIGMPAWLEDILPSGSSRRYWVKRLGLEGLSGWEQSVILLEKAVISPIGNVRIKEAQVVLSEEERTLRFSKMDVHLRQADFLDYAQAMGAMSGSASGAGGEAPKLLVRLDGLGQVWIDAEQADTRCLDAHYLVKFPRGKATQRDRDILRAESAYLSELSALGVAGIDAQRSFLMEEGECLSLWLPRFDVDYASGQVERWGMESLFSLLEKPSGTHLDHLEIIEGVCKRLKDTPGFDAPRFVLEWVKRDFLNVVFANSDNHGRNSAFLKGKDSIVLAPVFDFAPMRIDPEGIVRTIRWSKPLETGAGFDWQAIAQALAPWVEPLEVMESLRTLAPNIRGLKTRLQAKGFSREVLEVPNWGLDSIEKRLNAWGL